MRMKHYETKPTFTPPPPPRAVPMLHLLEERRAALQREVAQRLREAREQGRPADVANLSASLRAIKRKIASQKPQSGTARAQEGAGNV